MSNRQFLLIVTIIGLLTLAAFLLDTYQSCTSDGGQLGWMRRMGLECKRGPRTGEQQKFAMDNQSSKLLSGYGVSKHSDDGSMAQRP